MSISLYIARTDEEIDLALRLRHQVYVEEEGRFSPTSDGRLYDRFDAYRETSLVIARDNDHPERPCIGTVRFSALGPLGLPSDSYYRFDELIAERGGEGHFGTTGMLAVARQARLTKGIVMGLCKIAWRELRRVGVRFVVAPCAPDIRKLMFAMGAEDVGDTFKHGDPPVEMTPMLLDMQKIAPSFRETFVDPSNVLHEYFHERRLFEYGEYLVRQGDTGREAFMIMRGTARLHLNGIETPHLVGAGDLVGEIALLGDGVRTGSLVVESRLVDVGVIPRDDFQQRLNEDNKFVEKVVGFLLKRIRYRESSVPSRDEWSDITREQIAAQIIIEASAEGHEVVLTKWLEADTGLPEDQLVKILERWAASGVVEPPQSGMVKVKDPQALRALSEHLDAAVNLNALDPAVSHVAGAVE